MNGKSASFPLAGSIAAVVVRFEGGGMALEDGPGSQALQRTQRPRAASRAVQAPSLQWHACLPVLLFFAVAIFGLHNACSKADPDALAGGRLGWARELREEPQLHPVAVPAAAQLSTQEAQPIRRIAIVGERHSGTNLVEKLLKHNLDGDKVLVDGGLTRHKHWMQPDPENATQVAGTLLVLPVRNAYDWADALHRMCYCCEGMQGSALEAFVAAEYAPLDMQDTQGLPCTSDVDIEDGNSTYPSIMSMRVAKILNVVGLAERWSMPLEVVRLEDLWFPEMQVSWVEKLVDRYGLPLRRPDPPSISAGPGDCGPEGCIDSAPGTEGADPSTEQPQQLQEQPQQLQEQPMQLQEQPMQLQEQPQQQKEEQQQQPSTEAESQPRGVQATKRRMLRGIHRALADSGDGRSGNARRGLSARLASSGGGDRGDAGDSSSSGSPAVSAARDSRADAVVVEPAEHEAVWEVQPIVEEVRPWVLYEFDSQTRVSNSIYMSPAMLTNDAIQAALRAIDPLLDIALEAGLGYHRIVPEPPSPPQPPEEGQPSWDPNGGGFSSDSGPLVTDGGYYHQPLQGAQQPLVIEVDAGPQQGERGQQEQQEQPTVVLKFKASGWRQAGGTSLGQPQQEQMLVFQLGSGGWQVQQAEVSEGGQQQGPGLWEDGGQQRDRVAMGEGMEVDGLPQPRQQQHRGGESGQEHVALLDSTGQAAGGDSRGFVQQQRQAVDPSLPAGNLLPQQEQQWQPEAGLDGKQQHKQPLDSAASSSDHPVSDRQVGNEGVERVVGLDDAGRQQQQQQQQDQKEPRVEGSTGEQGRPVQADAEREDGRTQ